MDDARGICAADEGRTLGTSGKEGGGNDAGPGEAVPDINVDPDDPGLP